MLLGGSNAAPCDAYCNCDCFGCNCNGCEQHPGDCGWGDDGCEKNGGILVYLPWGSNEQYCYIARRILVLLFSGGGRDRRFGLVDRGVCGCRNRGRIRRTLSVVVVADRRWIGTHRHILNSSKEWRITEMHHRSYNPNTTQHNTIYHIPRGEDPENERDARRMMIYD